MSISTWPPCCQVDMATAGIETALKWFQRLITCCRIWVRTIVVLAYYQQAILCCQFTNVRIILETRRAGEDKTISGDQCREDFISEQFKTMSVQRKSLITSPEMVQCTHSWNEKRGFSALRSDTRNLHFLDNIKILIYYFKFFLFLKPF